MRLGGAGVRRSDPIEVPLTPVMEARDPGILAVVGHVQNAGGDIDVTVLGSDLLDRLQDVWFDDRVIVVDGAEATEVTHAHP